MHINEAVRSLSVSCNEDAVDCLWDFTHAQFNEEEFRKIVVSGNATSCFMFVASVLKSIDEERNENTDTIDPKKLAQIRADLKVASEIL